MCDVYTQDPVRYWNERSSIGNALTPTIYNPTESTSR